MKNRRLWLTACITILVLVMGCMLVACNKVGKLVSPTNVSYDGKTITWDAVAVPDEIVTYTVKINGGDELKVLTGTSFAYDAKGESFEVVVTAKYKKFEKSSDAVRFERLQTVNAIEVDEEGNLSWASIDGATGYEISNNGTIITSVNNSYSNLPVGVNRVKVRPISSDTNVRYYSTWSNEKRVNILAAPTKLKFDGTEIIWNAVAGAESYSVYVNGSLEAENLRQSKYAFNTNSDVEIGVKAVGDKVNSFDSGTVEEEYFYLLPITNLTVKDGILNWDSVENADAYKMRVDNVTLNNAVEVTSYSKLSAGESHDVQVMPIKTSGNYFSTWSTVKSIKILNAPSIDWKGTGDMEDGQSVNSIDWNAVEGAASYQVKIVKDGKEEIITIPNKTCAYDNAYLETGKYTVSVKAVADADGNYDSKFSNVIQVERLAGPTGLGQNFITSDARDLSQGFTVTFNKVPGAIEYKLAKNGNVIKTTTGTQFSDTEVYEGTGAGLEEIHSYSIRSVGSIAKGNGTVSVKLGCLKDNALSFDIKVLAQPQNFYISDFNATWSTVSSSSGYSIDLSGKAINSDATIRNLDADIRSGDWDIKVCAKGDGARVLASSYTPSIHIIRLSAPTDIRFVEKENNGILNTNSGAINDTPGDGYGDGYNIYVNGEIYSITETSLEDLYNNISDAGTNIMVQVTANKYKGNLYIMSSPLSDNTQFIRLKTPEVSANPFSDHVHFKWNAPINASDYAPTYKLSEKLPNKGAFEDHFVSGTEYNVSEAPGVYTYKVRAMGDGYKYVSSSESEEYIVTRLSTPDFFIEDNAYNWHGIAKDEGYSLKIDGKEVYSVNEDGREIYQCVPSFLTLGNKYVELTALGDGVKTINSKPYKFTQVINKCKMPSISSVTFSQSEKELTVTLEGTVDNTKNYSYSIGGRETVTDGLSATTKYESSGTFLVSVWAGGGVIDADGVYWIASNKAEKTITILGTPSTGSFSQRGGEVHWANIKGAVRYEYQIAYTDTGVYGEVMSTTVPQSDLLESDKTVQKIRVRAIGDDVNVFTGDWVEYVFA